MPKYSTLEYALYLFGRRNRTERELRFKLLEKKYPSAEIEAAVARLKEIGLLNDQRYAELYAEDKVRIYRRGRHRIGLELMLKGVDKELIKAAVDQINEDDEYAAAVSLLEGRRRSWRDLHERKRFERAFQLLQRRGFSAKVVRRAIENFEQEKADPKVG